jgi:hypothetical protein
MSVRLSVILITRMTKYLKRPNLARVGPNKALHCSLVSNGLSVYARGIEKQVCVLTTGDVQRTAQSFSPKKVNLRRS